MMAGVYAREFSEIPFALAQNEVLRSRALALVAVQPMAGKVTEGGSRMLAFRSILADLVNGQINVERAISRTQAELSRPTSLYSADNRVFAKDWDERLVRTQFSRFYNQAVMEQLLDAGETLCHVPHSGAEKRESDCSVQLAGCNHDVRTLHTRLVSCYAQGNWSSTVKIPDHPHCTHVVTPAV